MRVRIGLAVGLALLPLGVSVAKAAPCPAPPPPVRDLAPPRFYGDAKGSKIDADLQRQHKEAVEPLTAFLRRVVADTDKAVTRRDAQAARCPLAWIEAWAAGGAWLGQMGTKQAEYQRKWDLAGVALAYLKLRPYADPRQRAVIEPWLNQFAGVALAFFDDRARTRNNHWYWLGLGLAAVSLATDTPRHWDAARGIFRDGLKDIAADGTLPLELARAGRALHYHAFAVTPLVAMAELARLRGEDWYGLGGGALHRLIRLTFDGLADPAVFERLARHPQERPPGTGAGWLALYGDRFPERLPRASVDRPWPDVPHKHRWLGGDVRQLRAAIPPAGAPR